jgi:molybdopterin-guanine dinucleotide biosynthesis protein A
MPKIADITGVILAGGKSSRFGTNKALAPFRGAPLIEHVAETLRSVFRDVLVVTNAQQTYLNLGLPSVVDIVPDQGPMGGIVTAFQNTINDRIFAVACDMPVLDATAIREIISQAGETDAAVPVHDGIREYLMALYSRRLLPRMRCCLAEERLSLEDFCDKLTNVAWIPVSGDSWFNVNTKRDLEFLEAHHAG